jgi:hypothetical protein
VQVQAGHERREAVRVLRAQLGHGVVADARQQRGCRPLHHVLDRRVRERDDLLVALAGAVHLAEPRVEVEQRRDRAEALGEMAEARRCLAHLGEVPLGKDVRVDVDHRHGSLHARL